MTALQALTNGDLVAPYIDRAKVLAAGAARHFRANPDELAVAAAPFLMLALATRRHRLNVPEAILISECAFWFGVLAADAYRQWKERPAGRPTLRGI